MQLAKIHVQREESEARGAAPTAERRAPGRNVDDGLEPSDRTVDDGLEPRLQVLPWIGGLWAFY